MTFPYDIILFGRRQAYRVKGRVLGVFQESKAEKAIEALQEMSKAQSKVIRDGRQISIPSEDLVALALGFTIIPIVELGKIIHRIADKKHA